jgi:hypothetical protein
MIGTGGCISNTKFKQEGTGKKVYRFKRVIRVALCFWMPFVFEKPGMVNREVKKDIASSFITPLQLLRINQ